MATNPQEFDFDIGDVTGEKGDTGNGIKSIVLLSTSGLVKTYRITMTDDTTFDFSVSDGEDGNGISGASFDSQTNALTITFDDGTSFTTPSLKGVQGDPGDDGYSPAVTIETITGGHRVTITDEAHPAGQSFDVLDGASDAGNVSYNKTTTYQSGTVGAELQNLDSDKQDKTNYVTVSGTVVTQVGADNTMYLCGELAELTFTAPATGITIIRFTSGSTPTVITLNDITMPDDWTGACEANKRYDICVLNGDGLYCARSVT